MYVMYIIYYDRMFLLILSVSEGKGQHGKKGKGKRNKKRENFRKLVFLTYL